ncbi:hypothetical protein L218DRAFT_333727 [Marasmius fiardii PR-910]|nr:hypothetical protein L218DRAFT_333727 [Marasmius fiardii PR-910]
MKGNHRALNLTVTTSNGRNERGNQVHRPTIDIANFNYASPTLIPLQSAIPTISSLDSDDSTPTLKNSHFKYSGSPSFEKSPPSLTYGDDESVYSQDSACIILPPRIKVADATPKTALTFAAIWDPDRGFTTISGNHLLSNNNGTSIYGDDNDDHGNGHPDCEPHLSSRFSVTTTSTSNYIDVDFGDADNEGWNWNWSVGKSVKPSHSTSDYLRPGDLHPAWVPQIFNAGYLKPKPSRLPPKRPEISGPFQLTSSTALSTTIKPIEPHVQALDEYERPPPIPPSPPLPLIKSPQPRTLRRPPSRSQTRPATPVGSLTRSSTSSPTPTFSSQISFKRARLPSVFGKLKRSATTSSSPEPPSASPPPLSTYDNSIRQGWVLVDASKRKQSWKV